MKVKITKATKKSFWYVDRIGETFEVADLDSCRYIVTQEKPIYDDEVDSSIVAYETQYFIRTCDCVVTTPKKGK